MGLEDLRMTAIPQLLLLLSACLVVTLSSSHGGDYIHVPVYRWGFTEDLLVGIVVWWPAREWAKNTNHSTRRGWWVEALLAPVPSRLLLTPTGTLRTPWGYKGLAHNRALFWSIILGAPYFGQYTWMPPPLSPVMGNISSFHGWNAIFKLSAPLSALLWSIYDQSRSAE